MSLQRQMREKQIARISDPSPAVILSLGKGQQLRMLDGMPQTCCH